MIDVAIHDYSKQEHVYRCLRRVPGELADYANGMEHKLLLANSVLLTALDLRFSVVCFHRHRIALVSRPLLRHRYCPSSLTA